RGVGRAVLRRKSARGNDARATPRARPGANARARNSEVFAMTVSSQTNVHALVLDRARSYWRLTRMHRPIGTLLLLWPTMWALFVASDGSPGAYALFAFTAGTLLMRSAGCAINDWADRDFDPHVERTRERPLATGALHPWE